jgi:hypothetical protein
MLKRTYLIIGLATVLMFVVVGTIAQIISMKNGDKPLSMKVEVVSEANYSTKDIPIDVVFQNDGDKTVKLLNVFDDSKAVKIFFNVSLTDINETPISTTGGGKISLSENSVKYTELKKGERYKIRLNLKDFLPEDYSLKPGVYNVSVVYRNQYGKDCFKGELKSDSTSLNLIASQ